MTKIKRRPANSKESAAQRLDGVVIGVLMGFDDKGAPLVVFPGNPDEEAIAARTTARLGNDDVGSDVALMFEQGNPRQPLVLGRLLHPEVDLPKNDEQNLEVQVDDQRAEFTAEREVVLRCGKASITLTREGKILLRGAYIFSRSTGVNKIKGGSVQLN
ncbi:MAG: DUF6484 domain-containing protein [Geminicoccaceae bacterium]